MMHHSVRCKIYPLGHVTDVWKPPKKKYHRFSRWEVGQTHPIKVTPRDLEYLYHLFIHGPLSSAMLHQLICPGVNHRQTSERLKLLRHKPNCLVEVPKQGRLSYNANYQHLTYKITNAGVQVLLIKMLYFLGSRGPVVSSATELSNLPP